MKLCGQCKNRGKESKCRYYTKASNYAEICKDFEEKKQTNGDRIRSMSDGELADMFHNNGSYVENGEPKLEMWVKEKQIIIDDSYGCILEWLQSEVEE